MFILETTILIMKISGTRRVTRSMATPVAKRLRSTTVTNYHSAEKQHFRKKLAKKKSTKTSNSTSNGDGANANDDISTITVHANTPVSAPPSGQNVEIYPPAPPSGSSIHSDWLLNHPSCSRNDPVLTDDDRRRLDYRLRE